jgi:phosphoribosylformylglycinamidine (FGAM) synthase PurS component
MQIQEFLNSTPEFEPETIRALFPELSDIELEQIQVINILKNTTYFWEDMYVFENAVLVLNGIKPEVGFLQGVTPEQIWYAISVAKSVVNRKYSVEVKEYVRWIFNVNGTYVYPPELELSNPYFETAIQMAVNGPFPLGDNSVEEVQAGKYLAIKMYMDSKEAEETIKYNLEKHANDVYYTPTQEEIRYRDLKIPEENDSDPRYIHGTGDADGGVKFAPTVIANNSIYINAVSQTLTANSIDLFNFDDKFALCMWVKIVTANVWDGFFFIKPNQASIRYEWTVDNPEDYQRITMNVLGENIMFDQDVATFDNWVLLSLTRDAENDLVDFYINDVKIRTNSSIGPQAASQPFKLSVLGGTANDNITIYDVGFWRSYFSQSAITAVYGSTNWANLVQNPDMYFRMGKGPNDTSTRIFDIMDESNSKYLEGTIITYVEDRPEI